jgi:hydroxyethylthiazole kinase
MLKELWAIREMVREARPLVCSITNNVVTNFTANILLACGASPIMSEGAAEADDLAKISDAVVLNIGTLHTRQISYLLKIGECANKYKRPVIFDPVGAGATAYRSMTSTQILQDIKISLIRGNYGEIGFLAGLKSHVKGVDDASGIVELDSFKKLATQQDCLVAATGIIDYVTDGASVFSSATGHAILQAVTGTGCALSSLIGAFMAVTEDKKLAVLAALTFYGAAAEKAANSCKGPGSFQVKFIDALYNMSFEKFRKIAEDKVIELPVGQLPETLESADEE